MTCKDCIHSDVCDYWEKEAYPNDCDRPWIEVCEYFKASADLAPIKHGEWIEQRHVDRYGYYYNSHYKCSECGFEEFDEEYPYCPQCCARMDGGK